jgi:hypothetical protein
MLNAKNAGAEVAISKLKVVPEMREITVSRRRVLTPTGRYNVMIRKSGDVICTSSAEYVAEAIAELIINNLDEWNKTVDYARGDCDEEEIELNGRILDLD